MRPLDSARVACRVNASSAASNHTIQQMLRNTATFWTPSLTVVALQVEGSVDDLHTRNIKAHKASPPKQMQARENSTGFTRIRRRTRMQCRGPIYMSGQMSRQNVPAKHRSFRIQIRTQCLNQTTPIYDLILCQSRHYRPVPCIVHLLAVMYWPYPT